LRRKVIHGEKKTTHIKLGGGGREGGVFIMQDEKIGRWLEENEDHEDVRLKVAT
jgi:hypothetical protein